MIFLFFRIQQDEKTKNILALIEKEKVKINFIIHMMKLNIKIFFFLEKTSRKEGKKRIFIKVETPLQY